MTPTLVHRYSWPIREAIEQLLGDAVGDCEAWRIRIEADELVIDVVAPKLREIIPDAPSVETPEAPQELEKPEPADPPRKGGPIARQAGIICGEKGFWVFVHKRYGVSMVSADEAAAWLKAHCGVESRVDFDYDEAKAANFREIDKTYRLWLEGYDV